MSDRRMYDTKALERDLVTLAGRITIGATGAVTDDRSKGVTVTRTGVGAYTLTLDDAYFDILYCDAQQPDDDVSCSVQTIVDGASNLCTIEFQTRSVFAAVELSDPSFFVFHIICRNSSVS